MGDIDHVIFSQSNCTCATIGIMSVLESVHSSNDLDHPLCHNLRGGDWLINYTINRLRLFPAITKVSRVMNQEYPLSWLLPSVGCVVDQILENVKALPRYLIPCYFDAVISVIHREVVSSAIAHTSK